MSEVPRLWLELRLPPGGIAAATSLVEALPEGIVAEVTSGMLVWGPLLRQAPVPVCVTLGSSLGHATCAAHAEDLANAALVQCLSALSRRSIDYVLLSNTNDFGEEPMAGICGALSDAIDEGVVGRTGILLESALAEADWFRPPFSVYVSRTGDVASNDSRQEHPGCQRATLASVNSLEALASAAKELVSG